MPMTPIPASSNLPAGAWAGALAWLGRPIPVALAALTLLTLVGWAALMIEAAQGGFTRQALFQALCRPAALRASAPATEFIGRLATTATLWCAMAFAMMAPTAAPMALAYADKAQAAARAGLRPVSVLIPIAGYFGVWIGFAVLAALLQTALATGWPLLGLPERATIILAGSAIGAAGLYQFSEAKAACLSFCRHPFPALGERETPSRAALFRLGSEQGMACLGCCFALMGLMLIAGVMNLFWMAVLSLLMTIEKLTAGPAVTRAIGVMLVAAGLAVAFGAVGLDSVAHWLTTR